MSSDSVFMEIPSLLVVIFLCPLPLTYSLNNINEDRSCVAKDMIVRDEKAPLFMSFI